MINFSKHILNIHEKHYLFLFFISKIFTKTYNTVFQMNPKIVQENLPESVRIRITYYILINILVIQ